MGNTEIKNITSDFCGANVSKWSKIAKTPCDSFAKQKSCQLTLLVHLESIAIF